MNRIPIKRALLSVSDKSGIVELADVLARRGVEIISTGGTSQLLKTAGIPHREVEEITGLAEMLGGRVKTLHPLIHGGILGKRDLHAAEAVLNNIQWIDLVVVNFYPFEEVIQKQGETLSFDEVVEYIDVGGPTMVRAAAKNFSWVGVVTDPSDYALVIEQLNEYEGLELAIRKQFAQKAFAKTSRYDGVIHQYFLGHQEEGHGYPDKLDIVLEKWNELRYGENPHQKAYAYQLKHETTGLLSAAQFQGKPLSYNNILDAEAALTCVLEFSEPACVIVKHANPCGVAIGATIEEAFKRALEADSQSAFGGIVALNRPCNAASAKAIASIFMEVVIAPAYAIESQAIFADKPNLRVLEMPSPSTNAWEMRFVTGGVLIQEKNNHVIQPNELVVKTSVKPSQQDIDNMLFAWRVLKHVKSNGILIAKDNTTIGIGAGQVSRIDAVDMAVRKANNKIDGAVLASDAFFPFRDSIDRIANHGIRAIIQPGGSVRDEEVIAACNEHGIAMVFTGKRCFRH